jgi:hypothetical protein
MLKRALLAALLALAPIYAQAASYIWNQAPTQIRNSAGVVQSGALVYFYLEGTTTNLVTYSDAAQTTPHTQPVVASNQGVPAPVYIPYSSTGYRVVIKTSGGTTISDTDGIARHAPPDTGGGVGIVVATEQVFQPGWTVFLLQTGTVTGFVRLNGRTVGSATSGATERANADTENLYSYFWTNCANAQCAVSGGRGGSAAADFAANKTLALPSMRGRSPMGLDDMGNSAANVAQVSPTIDTHSNTTAEVSSATGVVIGQTIVSANIAAGTTVTAVSGLTITLSQAATGTAAGTAARFSMLADAQVASATGGGSTQSMVIAELPTVTPAGSIAVSLSPGSNAGIPTGVGANVSGNFGGGGAFTATGAFSALGAVASTFTGTAFGSNRPHTIQNPVIAGGWYSKL